MKKILVLILLLILTGCSNYHELEDLDIVSSIYINYENNNYYIDCLINKDIISSTGKSLTEVFNNIHDNKKYLYYNHLNSLILNTKVNINEIMEYYSRNTNVNTNFKIVLVDDIELSNDINSIIKNNINNEYTFFNIIKKYYENDYYLLPFYNNGIKEYNILKKDKIITTLDSDKYNIYKILNKKNKSIINTTYKNDYYIVETNNISIRNNKIDIEVTLKELNSNIDTTKLDSINILEDKLNKNISTQINNLINYFNEYDIKSYDKYKNIEISSHINKKGLILK